MKLMVREMKESFNGVANRAALPRSSPPTRPGATSPDSQRRSAPPLDLMHIGLDSSPLHVPAHPGGNPTMCDHAGVTRDRRGRRAVLGVCHPRLVEPIGQRSKNDEPAITNPVIRATSWKAEPTARPWSVTHARYLGPRADAADRLEPRYQLVNMVVPAARRLAAPLHAMRSPQPNRLR